VIGAVSYPTAPAAAMSRAIKRLISPAQASGS